MHNKYTQHTHIYNVNKIAWQHYKLHIQILQIIIFTESVSDVYLNKSVMKSSFFKCLYSNNWLKPNYCTKFKYAYYVLYAYLNVYSSILCFFNVK